ncbi:TRAP-type C4-dicarboxylate transport system, substrate-binding protein [Enterovibrio norvegicus DSM 15893]|uniref:TRAP-type C4-dicarboxylate transport system, substrate-binding protein n=1 Tax=Enterovibrio norvegicus DSM 15893 TaxID=1121869 RepID=A0A1I5LU59_9GAMM|nr:TRAP-type C4-dicarboxylate transport system, substrate-binding protein [Enterovibrio norvegicus DSM 15893]
MEKKQRSRRGRFSLSTLTSLLLVIASYFTSTTVLFASTLPKHDVEKEPTTWRFGLEEIEGSLQHIYAKAFKKRIEEKTQGAIDVDIYSYGTLGESEDLTNLTAQGTVQLAHASTGILGKRIPEMQVFTLPYLLSHDGQRNKRILSSNSTLYGVLGNALIDQNLRLLTLYSEGDMVWTTNELIRHPRDFDAFKMRVMSAPLNIDTFRLYGADPVSLPYSEIYSALQSYRVDGQSNPIFAIEEMRFYEVTDYMIWSGQQKFITSIIANQAWYLRLPADQKKALRSTITEMTDIIHERQEALNHSQLNTIKREKPDMVMLTLNSQQKRAFKQRAKPVREKYIEMTGKQGKRLLEALEKAFDTGP